MLLWGTVVAVPQMIPLLFIQSIEGALIAAVPRAHGRGCERGGPADPVVSGGVAGLGADDVGARSISLSPASGNVFGATLYDHYGGFGT
ncbi:MAG: hypothetical protein JO212_18405 [Acetobacteraceae bacterium]|nr:hypothetical protein [Acetobacteraceae bacterium]